MNMKKTIAAVAACAMAVSAMATTVSAVDENATEGKSVNYNLTVKTKAAVADLTFIAKAVSAADGNNPYVLKVFAPKSLIQHFNSEVTVTVADKSTKTSYAFTFQADNSKANYDGIAKLEETNAYNPNFRIAGVPAVGGAASTAVQFGDSTQKDVVGDQLENLNGLADGKAVAGSLYTITIPKTSTIYKAFEGANDIDITVSMSKALVASTANQSSLNAALTAAVPTVGLTGFDATQTIVNGRAAVTESEVKVPFATSYNTKSPASANIINYLETTNGVKGNAKDGNDKYYQNVNAVINDMIANYDDVVFTFNTATDNVLTYSWISGNAWTGISTDFAGYYATGVPGAESWMGDDTYKAFPQHLYNLYGDEATTYTYSDSYTFNNLFNAALVANNGYTMNQSTVTPFEYSKTSVSFSWADLTGGNSFVSPASAVNSLQLMTSATWYWDSMDVTGYTLAADDASTDAGIEDDGADLDDDAADDADVADDDVADDDVADDDAAADDVADDDVADDDVAADDTAADDTAADSNPATGNAPIALAVIPVALAAAAVVAKKRG